MDHLTGDPIIALHNQKVHKRAKSALVAHEKVESITWPSSHSQVRHRSIGSESHGSIVDQMSRDASIEVYLKKAEKRKCVEKAV